jgi:hypothetical protein
VAEEDESGAVPLFLPCGDFLLPCVLDLGSFRGAKVEKGGGCSVLELRHTFWSFHFLKKGMQSIIMNGAERPK